MDLLTVLEKKVEDPRRSQGLRTTIGQIFVMVIVSNLCGYFGGRAIAQFAQKHSKTFTDVLQLKHPIPSHVTFTTIFNRIDSQQIIEAFNDWANHFAPIEKEDFVSGDGKALASTFNKKAHKKYQEFEAIVSLYGQKSGLVHAISEYQNKKKSEISVVLFLIQNLQAQGMTIVLDALHTQKKQSKQSSKAKIIT